MPTFSTIQKQFGPGHFSGFRSIGSAFFLLYLLSALFSIAAAAGDSKARTLVMPSGARQNGMGEVGTALADDESVVFWNPAGLGIKNKRWRKGRISYFYEPVLSILRLSDLRHLTAAFCYEPSPTWRFGSMGVSWNRLNLGLITYKNDLDEFEEADFWESVWGLSWGINLADLVDLGENDHATGLSVKLLSSNLFGPDPATTKNGFAIDLGYLYRHSNGFRLGFTLLNMGRIEKYSENSPRPALPFTVSLAPGYKREFHINGYRALRIASEFCLRREFTTTFDDKDPDPFYKAIFSDLSDNSFTQNLEEITYTIGTEFTIFNTGSIRFGVLHDIWRDMTEFHLGTGVSLFNHFEIDWYFIISPEKSPLRHKQWGISLSLQNPFFWTEADNSWFLVKERD